MEKAKRGLWIRYICDYENTVKKTKKQKKQAEYFWSHSQWGASPWDSTSKDSHS